MFRLETDSVGMIIELWYGIIPGSLDVRNFDKTDKILKQNISKPDRRFLLTDLFVEAFSLY